MILSARRSAATCGSATGRRGCTAVIAICSLIAFVATQVGGCGRIRFDEAVDAGYAVQRPPPGAALIFHFDEAAGPTTTSEDGQIVASLVGDVGRPPGIRGRAVSVSSRAYVDAPSFEPILRPGAVSLSVWYRLDTDVVAGQCAPLLIHGSAGSAGSPDNDIYAINLIPPNLGLYSEHLAQSGNDTVVTAPVTAFMAGAWHHVVVTRDGAGAAFFYIDGGAALVPSVVQPADGGRNGHLRIGADVDVSWCISFAGSVDELYIYPRQLDASEARALFDAR
jgi:hypothetical protein